MQAEMPLNYKGIPLFQRLVYRIRKQYRVLEQIKFWRSFALWFNIFCNAIFPFLLVSWLFRHLSELPRELPFIFYYEDPSSRFLPAYYIAIIVGFNVLVQLITLGVCSRLFTKLKALSFALLVSATVSSLMLYASLYKALLIVVP